MIDNDILERVLAEGLRTGADFAEVFASDWRGTGVGLDDGKIEQLSTGRNRVPEFVSLLAIQPDLPTPQIFQKPD